MEKEVKEIVIRQNTAILFPKGEENGDILILGNFNGVCGDVVWHGIDNCSFEDNNFFKFQDTFLNNIEVLLNTLRAGNRIFIVASKDTIDYFKRLLYTIADTFMDDMSPKARKKMFNKQVWTIDTTELYERTYVKYNSSSDYRKEQAQRKIDEIVTNKIFEKIQHMKFDYIIQNPPYNGNLHLDFFEKGLNLLNEKGKMVIIEPSTWLINIRNSGGSANKFSHIKKLIEGHVESIKIENYNKEFGTSQYVPFAITTVDFSKTFETIDFYCCGEKKVVNSIYDCNLVGEYNLIWSILNKVKNFGDMMINHTTTKDMGDGMYYAKYYELVAMGGLGITSRANCGGIIVENAFNNDIFYYNGFGNAYFDGAYSVVTDEIRNTPLRKYKVGGKPGSHIESDKIADNVYGTKEEIENWRHFILKNKLPLFISIALTIHQQNVVTGWLPWLVDKQYTDEEINEMFGFTNEEIAFINRTLKKFERNSPWFKRYMCGPDSVSDEEVNNFINSL